MPAKMRATNARSVRGNSTSFAALVGLLLSLPQVAYGAEPEAAIPPDVEHLENGPPKRILFVGNSYLYYNDSLHNHVRRIADEIGPYEADEYQYKSATIGGARLSHHAIDSLLEPGRLGIDKAFELVVLQGGSAEVLTSTNRERFRESALEVAEKSPGNGRGRRTVYDPCLCQTRQAV